MPMSSAVVVAGDCLAPDGLPSLPADSVDVVATDSPYDKATHGKQRRGIAGDYVEPTRPGATRAQRVRNVSLGFEPLTPEQMTALARHYARISRRWVLNFCSLEMISDWKRELEAAGLEYVRSCIWHRLNCMPQRTGDRPAQAAEAIVVAHRPGKKRWNGRGSHGWFDFSFGPEDDLGDVVFDDAIVLNRGQERQRFHTTQKPIKLMQKLVALFSDPGELVLDPFAGSGTTGIACVTLGRAFLGMELDPRYAEVANWRIGRAQGKILPVPDALRLLDDERAAQREPNITVTEYEHGIEAVRKFVPDAPSGSGVQTSAARAREVLGA
jgi:DNA modification methylase